MSHSQCDIDVNLWSFIKCTKATQLAPLRVLQEFVLSLNKRELTHLIKSYLQSKLSTNNTFNANGLTMRQTAHRLLNNTTINHTLRTVDTQIVSKLTQRYGMKYRRNVISHTQQTNSDCKRMNLLSIHPQVLAYSFQFLSFRELCKVQSVCVHFTYLNKHYPALTHYYLELDRTFCQKAMRFKVLLSNLSFFKHIAVEAIYCDLLPWNKDYERSTKLFQLVLKTVINQSKSSLDILTIGIASYCSRRVHQYAINKLPPFNTLLYIMNEVDHLNVRTLHWNQDYFKPSSNCDWSKMLEQIKAKLVHCFPLLRSLSIGKKSFLTGNWNRGPTSKDIPHEMMVQHILSPAIHGFGTTLESLCIDSQMKIDLFDQNTNLIALIATHMINLKTLSFSLPRTGTASDLMNNNNMLQHTNLRKLRVGNMQGNEDHPNKYLMHLFSTFIGISDFECEFDWRIGYGLNNSDVNINWQNIFFTLMEEKRMYSIHTGHMLPPLESLKFNLMHNLDMINSLIHLRMTSLVHLEVHATRLGGYRSSMLTFVRFLKLHSDSSSKLRSIKLYCGWETSSAFSLQPIVNVLSNIPPTIRSLHIDLPPMPVTTQKIKEIESVNLVKQLCQVLLESKEKGKLQLETIRLDSLTIPLSVKKHLLFWFGFQNNLSIAHGDSYYLKFI
eukprot:1022611_1